MIDHDEGRDCWCKPVTTIITRADGSTICEYVHHNASTLRPVAVNEFDIGGAAGAAATPIVRGTRGT